MSEVENNLVTSLTADSAPKRKPWSAPRLIMTMHGRAAQKNGGTTSTPDQHFTSTTTTS